MLAEKKLLRRIFLKIPHFLSAPAIIRNSELILTIPYVGAKMLQQNNSTRLLPIPLKIPDYDYIQVWGNKRHGEAFHQWVRQSIKIISSEKTL
jgi:hypothetical protein